MFGNWLEARWCVGNPAEPDGAPDAVSVLGGAGAGIRWYTVGDTVVGFISGRPRGCYVVAREDRPLEIPPPNMPAANDADRVPEAVR
jgi:hypothetical protein